MLSMSHKQSSSNPVTYGGKNPARNVIYTRDLSCKKKALKIVAGNSNLGRNLTILTDSVTL